MKLSKKLRRRIKSTALMLLSVITVAVGMLAVDKEINNTNSIVGKVQSNIQGTETTTIDSTYDASTTSLTSSTSNANIDADIFVSTTGNDETGDGTVGNPYATVSKAINAAQDGQKIYIMPGTYTLAHMTTSYGTAGIYDLGKNLEIFGENEETILIYNGTESTGRDAHTMSLANSNTIVRNLTYIFYPKAGSNYQRAMFGWSNGIVSNVFFRISGSNKASYIYNNSGGTLRVENSTFFHDLGGVDANYSGNCSFTNIATNVLTNGTNTNVVTESFGTADTSLSELIKNSEENASFVENEVGVYSGEYAWNSSIYSLNCKKTYLEIGKTLNLSIINSENQDEDVDESQWMWSSSNESIATVNNGVVTGISPGEITISAYNPSDESKLTAKVFVYEKTDIIVDICVSTTGNDETGDGSLNNPYASVKKAIEEAEEGQKIYIFPGTYELEPISAITDGSGQAGIADMGKKLEIFGENEETVLIYRGTDSTLRDGPAINITNSETVVRNLTYVFYPKSGDTYQRAIFQGTQGTVKNVFFRISGDNKAIYTYYNYQTQATSNNVENCTFFHDLGGVDSSYSGICNFTNIATNVSTDGTNTNVLTKNFGTADTSLSDLIYNSEVNDDFIKNDVGVYSGELAWNIERYNIKFKKNYQLNYKNAYLKVGDTLNLEIEESTGQEENPDENEFIWKSTNEDIAIVNEYGVVTGKEIGITAIKVYDSSQNYIGTAMIRVVGEEGTAVPKIVGGYNHFVALKSDGTVWTWGSNSKGQLGLGDTTKRTEPTQVMTTITLEDGSTKKEAMTDVVDIAAGNEFTVILKADGTVWTAGYNCHGQLGDGTTNDSTEFIQVKGTDGEGYLNNIMAITADLYTSHALTTYGSVYSWGYNGSGQFGIGTTTNSSYPVKMQKVSNIIQIEAGNYYLTMLDADGSVWNVGYNHYGKFGVNNTSDYNLPIQMQDTDGSTLCGVKEIANGLHHTVVLKENGEVWRNRT